MTPLRHLALSITGCLALAGLLLAPVAARAGELSDLVPEDAGVRKVAGGFAFTEGPAQGPSGRMLFSDIPANRIVELLDDGEARDFLRPSGRANGLVFDAAGHLYACQGGARRVVRIDPEDAEVEAAVASTYDGAPLNSPNDLALDGHGGLYFTDPRYGSGSGPVEQPVMGVYYVASDGSITRVVDSLDRPNGVLVSPGGKWLWVANPDRREVWRWPIRGPGELGDGERVFTGDPDLDGGGPDGMAHDAAGNVWATYSGIVVLDPEGELIGRIEVPERPANCTFGGEDRGTLYITARTSLYAIPTRVEGAPLRESGPMGHPLGDEDDEDDEDGRAESTRTIEAGDLRLEVPESWERAEPESRFRVAQFRVPAAGGDEEPAEVIVYSFPGGAGGVRANVRRWIRQFAPDDRWGEVRRGEGRQGPYTLVDLRGTYRRPVGPPIRRKTRPVEDWRVVNAIVEHPQGVYYVKLTGPERTVDRTLPAFRRAIGTADPDDEKRVRSVGDGGDASASDGEG